ncbi:MAG TPA: sigma-70 family RNA polymerase sigma factor [Steroidobacteraceae bacterium]|nr:sigma-70 family RNA polymerase sigma factor [Steroidobacteraceae bacterium]
MDDKTRHQWVATHILPHEGEARGWLRRHIHRLVPSDLDDLIQEAYARLWGAELRGIANGRSYLFTVIRNLLSEQARRARIVPMERMSEIDSLRIPSEEPGPDRRVSALQELERLERVVEQLPKQCRHAFRLQKFHGLSQQEIARKMSISEKTVEKHLATALFRVTQSLKEDMGDAPESRLEIGEYDSARNKD